MKRANGWTSERKEKQSAFIRNWKPWESATGPKTIVGKRRSSRNAFKNGLRPQQRAQNREYRKTKHLINAILLELKTCNR